MTQLVPADLPNMIIVCPRRVATERVAVFIRSFRMLEIAVFTKS
jgi:hypothetical protein